jgi:hypothetical protein
LRRGTLLTRKDLGAPFRIWALLGARAGDNNQVIALAEAIGQSFEIKQLEYNGLRRLGPRLLGRSLMSLTKRSRQAILSEPPPDLTISAGHRSVAVVRALRHRSGRRTRSIHVGFPRISPRHFDLVIATLQYPIPDHPNLLRVPYALTRAATAASDPSDAAMVAALPMPRRAADRDYTSGMGIGAQPLPLLGRRTDGLRGIADGERELEQVSSRSARILRSRDLQVEIIDVGAGIADMDNLRPTARLPPDEARDGNVRITDCDYEIWPGRLDQFARCPVQHR